MRDDRNRAIVGAAMQSKLNQMKQHTTPCADCPFRKKTGVLGGSPPETYVGQAHGPFFLPCHSTHDHTKLEARLNRDNTQCAGAAIFRANIGRDTLMPDKLLHLPADTKDVFASHAELLAFHLGISLEEAEARLKIETPVELMHRELRKGAERTKQGKAFMERV